MTAPEWYSLILALTAAAATGFVGAFALMKRMTLAGDTMSHIALPGLGLAILWNINPLIGAAVALGIGALIIWKIEERTGLATETTIGVIFSAALALGALVTPSEDLITALFGGGGAISTATFFIYVGLSFFVMLFVYLFRHKLVLTLFNADLAKTSGVDVSRLNLYYLLIFSLTLVLGLRFLGALLVGSLIIVPAAISRQLTHTLRNFLFASAGAAVLSVGLGFAANQLYSFPLGPTVVIISAALFLLSLLKKKD